MKIHHLKFRLGRSTGFALPTVLLSSVILLALLMVSVSAIASLRVGMNTQYYDQLARAAAESGVAKVSACLEANAYVVTWSESKPLTPQTDCQGNVLAGQSAYVLETGLVRTSFRVGLPETSALNSYVNAKADAKVEILRKGTVTPWQTYSKTLANVSRMNDIPVISGGSGWKDNGHIVTVLTASRQLYGAGENIDTQITDSGSPANITNPVKMQLPPGVLSIKQAVTSGQGGSFVCIIGDNDLVYCRGGGGGGGVDGTTGAYMLEGVRTWARLPLPSGLRAKQVVANAFGTDSVCALTTTNRVFCAGHNLYGRLGVGSTDQNIPYATSPTREVIAYDENGVRLYFKKVYSNMEVTCSIATNDDLYCSGPNAYGKLTGPTSGSSIYTPIRYSLPKYTGSNIKRKIEDVFIPYHGGNGAHMMYILATDGTIWASGTNSYGSLAPPGGSTTYSTGSTQTPQFWGNDVMSRGGYVQFTANGVTKCFDNDSGGSANGNIIHLWTCNDSSANQEWMYTNEGQIYNPRTDKCLDVPAQSVTLKTAVQLYQCNNTLGQKFEWREDGTIRYMKDPTICLDIQSNNASDGVRPQIYTCNGTNAQKFMPQNESSFAWRAGIIGSREFCAIRSDYVISGAERGGDMRCAGPNEYGQLGNTSSTHPSLNHEGACVGTPVNSRNVLRWGAATPTGGFEKVDVSKLTSEWQQQYNSLMVITKSGRVMGSGLNQYGKLGNGALGDAANGYRQCGTVEFKLPVGVKAVSLSARDEYTAYVLGDDGNIYASGRNNNGQIGDGTTTDRHTPVVMQIPRTTTTY